MDKIYNDVIRFTYEKGETSVSMLQREFSISFPRAIALIDQLIADGYISAKKENTRYKSLVTSVVIDNLQD